jgi:hypothetical protein
LPYDSGYDTQIDYSYYPSNDPKYGTGKAYARYKKINLKQILPKYYNKITLNDIVISFSPDDGSDTQQVDFFDPQMATGSDITERASKIKWAYSQNTGILEVCVERRSVKPNGVTDLWENNLPMQIGVLINNKIEK